MSAAYSLNAKHYSNPFAKIRFKTIPEIIQKKKRAITNEQENSLLDDYEKLMKSKMRFQLRAALANNKTVLILGAFGCGSFANPPEEVARLYKEVLEEPEFNEAFEHIIFANLVTSDRDMDNFVWSFLLLNGSFAEDSRKTWIKSPQEQQKAIEEMERQKASKNPLTTTQPPSSFIDRRKTRSNTEWLSDRLKDTQNVWIKRGILIEGKNVLSKYDNGEPIFMYQAPETHKIIAFGYTQTR